MGYEGNTEGGGLDVGVIWVASGGGSGCARGLVWRRRGMRREVRSRGTMPGRGAGKSAKNGLDAHGYYLIYSTMDPAVPRTFYKWLFVKDLRGLIFCIFGVF